MNTRQEDCSCPEQRVGGRREAKKRRKGKNKQRTQVRGAQMRELIPKADDLL